MYQRQDGSRANETSPADDPAGSDVSIRDVLITEELDRRPARPPDFAAENQALVALATVMAEAPDRMFQAMADTALELCGAGSAGVSVWERGGEEEVFRWRGTAGDYAPFSACCRKS